MKKVAWKAVEMTKNKPRSSSKKKSKDAKRAAKGSGESSEASSVPSSADSTPKTSPVKINPQETRAMMGHKEDPNINEKRKIPPESGNVEPNAKVPCFHQKLVLQPSEKVSNVSPELKEIPVPSSFDFDKNEESFPSFVNLDYIEGGNRILEEFNDSDKSDINFSGSPNLNGKKSLSELRVDSKFMNEQDEEEFPDPEEVLVSVDSVKAPETNNKKKDSVFVRIPNKIWYLTPRPLTNTIKYISPAIVSTFVSKTFQPKSDGGFQPKRAENESVKMTPGSAQEIPPIFKIAALTMMMPFLVILWPLFAVGAVGYYLHPKELSSRLYKVFGEKLLGKKND